MVSKGIWAPADNILAAKQEVTAKRATPAYANERKRELARRQAKQKAYTQEFNDQIINFLNFHPRYEKEAQHLGKIITNHATPVGSGTVARTQRIPINKRAQAAVIAWMRHKTTAYDSMKIPRVKGKRREARRGLAKKSIEVLENISAWPGPKRGLSPETGIGKKIITFDRKFQKRGPGYFDIRKTVFLKIKAGGAITTRSDLSIIHAF